MVQFETERITFDIECFSNFFICAVRLRTLDGAVHSHCFLINERERARKAFSRKKCLYAGHNICGYDMPMVALWLDGGNEAQLHELNDYMIMGTPPSSKRVASWISENIRTTEFTEFGKTRRTSKLGWTIMQRLGWNSMLTVDTWILGESVGSLKNCAINLGFSSLVESPVEWDKELTVEDKQLVVDYCWHDIEVTEALTDYYEQTIAVRKTFFDQGISDAYTVGSAKLAELYLSKRYEMIVGAEEFARWKLKAYDTAKKHAPTNKVRELIGDYKFSFSDSGFSKLYNRIIDCDFVYGNAESLSGVAVGESEEGNTKVKMREPSAYRTMQGLHVTKGDLIITDDRGAKYQFGSGGLHNLAPRGIWKETSEMCIFNTDASSMYPSLVVKNGYRPRQFLELASILGDLLTKRLILKKANKKVEEQALKLVLNSCFGKFNERKSILFDPKACFSVTVSGQLLLLLLIDLVYRVSEDTKVINANTDGVCFYVPKKDLPIIESVIQVFQTMSKLTMENEYYSIFAQMTCNGYCALTPEGKVKSKGSGFKEKVTSMKETMVESRASKKMAIRCLLHGIHPSETCATLPKEDFCMSAGFGGKRSLVVDGVQQKGRRALRYAWVKNGSVLQKLESRGLSIVGEGQKCQVVDSLDDLDYDNLNFGYYVEKAMVKVLEIVGTHTALGLPKKVLKDIPGNFGQWFNSQNPT